MGFLLTWKGWARLLLLVVALVSLYQAVELGVTGEEGLRYNPNVSTHPAFVQMQRSADRWMYGCWAAVTGIVVLSAWSYLARRSKR